MLPPTGEQFEIRGGEYRAVVTECGASLRVLDHAGRALIDGYDEDAMPCGWPWAAADAVAEPDRRRRLLVRRPRPPARALRAGSGQRLARAGPVGGVEHRGAHAALGLAGLPADGADRLPVDPGPARALRPVRGRPHRHPDRHQHVGVGGAVRPGCASLPAGGVRPGRPARAAGTGRYPAAGGRPDAADWSRTGRRLGVRLPGVRGRSGRRSWTTGSPTSPGTTTARPPSSCAIPTPAGASRSGSTGSIAGCRCSAPTRRRAPPAGRWPWSR